MPARPAILVLIALLAACEPKPPPAAEDSIPSAPASDTAASVAAPAAGLPFTGKRRFTFLSSTGTEYSLTIEENGNTTLQAHSTYENATIYQGAYQADLPIYNEEGKLTAYYRIDGEHIRELNPAKEAVLGCNPIQANEPCRAELTHD